MIAGRTRGMLIVALATPADRLAHAQTRRRDVATERRIRLSVAVAERGACRGSGVDFFPVARPAGRHPSGGPPDLYAPARALCARCPVRTDCLTLGINERHGMWGGTTPEDRQVLRAERSAS